MSYTEVMYQPYTSYFPRHTNDYSKRYGYGLQKLQDLADGSAYANITHSSGHRAPPAATITKEEVEAERDVQPTDAKYLSASCLLLTYFSGDIASNVDEHFTRALSQPSSYNAEHQGSKPPSKDSSPMAHRNFPPSFWNSTYVATPSLVGAAGNHHDLSQFAGDPYLSSTLHHGMAGVHHHQDPWHYPLTSQPHTYAHRAVHDLTYSPMHASSSRFASHFSPLLPTGRLGSIHGQSSGDTWSTRYHADHHMPSLASHTHTEPKGLETLTHDSGKELQWY